jgi:hypothetical protein
MIRTDQAAGLSLIVEHHKDPAGNVNQTMRGFFQAVLKPDGDVFVLKVKVTETTDHVFTPGW